MSAQRQDAVRRITAPEITARKGRTPIVCLTAYSTPVAEVLDAITALLAGVWLALFGWPVWPGWGWRCC